MHQYKSTKWEDILCSLVDCHIEAIVELEVEQIEQQKEVSIGILNNQLVQCFKENKDLENSNSVKDNLLNTFRKEYILKPETTFKNRIKFLFTGKI
jgi:hypothetical protein